MPEKCIIIDGSWQACKGVLGTFSGLLEGLSKISFAARTLSAEKQTLVVPVGNLTTFARSVSLSCDAVSSL